MEEDKVKLHYSKIRKEAWEMSSKLMITLMEDLKEHSNTKDPGDQIYCLAYLTGYLNAKIFKAVEGYANTYAIQELTAEDMKRWTEKVAREMLDLFNKEN